MTPHLRIRGRHLLASDAVLILASILASYAIRFETLELPWAYVYAALVFAAVATPIKLAIYYVAGLYRRLWRYASISELERVLVSAFCAGLASFIIGAVILPKFNLLPARVPVSVLFLDACLSAWAVALPRFLARLIGWRTQRRRRDDDVRAIVAGAGAAGQLIAKEMLANPKLGMSPVAFVDDDERKAKHRVHEIPVLGKIADIRRIALDQRARMVVIAMPSAPGSVVRRIVSAASEAGLKTRILPSLSDLLSGRGVERSLREVQIEDLLRREPVQTDLAAVRNLAHGRTVMVTGAGGSIGSELCRQVASLSPARLVLLGHGENSIFDIQAELRCKFPRLPIVAVIADVRDRGRMMTVMDELRPYALFHAAAHKHVPLMEENVVEAITNNVQGTKNVVEAAVSAGVEHLVLISTDKAVRPTSIMGASKRLAERIVQHAAVTHGRNFVSVRFGNVLGSRGSVVPTFMNQIRAGGPVTVTHPDMRRYFMTIPEAVQLVLQAGALGNGGEVFVLDMGEPVRIADLAADLIGLCGLEVGHDIEIKFTGIRAGEKLYEEMFFHEENAVPTDHPKVLRAKKAGIPDGLMKLVDRLIAETTTAEATELREMLIALVPDFQREPTAPLERELDVLPLRRTGQFQAVGTPS